MKNDQKIPTQVF